MNVFQRLYFVSVCFIKDEFLSMQKSASCSSWYQFFKQKNRKDTYINPLLNIVKLAKINGNRIKLNGNNRGNEQCDSKTKSNPFQTGMKPNDRTDDRTDKRNIIEINIEISKFQYYYIFIIIFILYLFSLCR